MKIKKIVIWIGVLGIALALGISIRHTMPSHLYPATIIHSYDQVQDVLAACDSSSLVIFDIDDTLLACQDVLARGFEWPWWVWVHVAWHFPQFLKRSVWEYYNSLTWGRAPRSLVEPQVTAMIDQLKKQGALVIGLTTLETGSYGLIPNMVQWRYDMLASFGIYFSLICKDRIFFNFPAYRGFYPALYRGILFTNHQTKGDVLQQFLKECEVHPHHVIFFDDQPHNLQSVGHVCHHLGISCSLYQYAGVYRIAPHWKMEDLIKRISRVMQLHRWVGPEEAIPSAA